MTPYQHGGDVETFAAKCGCTSGEVIDLSSNINFMTPEIDLSGTVLNSYPNYDALTQALAARYHVAVDEMELFNGGSSAIFSLMRSLCNATCTIYAPAYGEYKKAAELCGKEVELVNRFEEMERNVAPGALVVFVNPSTPDGRYYAIDDLMERWIDKNCTILIDESFLEFCEGESVSRYLQNYDKLYVLKSMTKFYGCAGVRAGVVLSCAENIRALKRVEPLWKLSAFDAAFLIQALQDETFRAETLARNAAAKEYLASIIDHSGLFDRWVPSDANFFLVTLSTMNAREFQEKLVPHRIMVRDCSNFDFLSGSHVRIAVKDLAALKRFEEALCSLV